MIWFVQVEAQFTTRGITQQDTKFAYVVSALQPEIAQEIRDILITPPSDHKYDVLKRELIKRTGESEQRRLHQLLITENLGDRKPSQLLRKMQQLLGDRRLEESIFKQLFLQRLPCNVQSILASSKDTLDISGLAEMADKIMEVSSAAGTNINAVTQISHDDSLSFKHEITDLKKMVASLTLQMQALTSNRSRSRSPNPQNPRSFNRRRSNSRDSHRLIQHAGAECWYHWQYGDQARKCTPPCSKHNPLNSNAGN